MTDIAFFNGALTWVDSYAEEILAARNLYLTALSETTEDNQNTRKKAYAHVLAYLHSRDQALWKSIGNVPSGKHLFWTVDTLRNACCATICGLTGMRGHELLWLDVGCVTHRVGADGTTQISYIEGRTSKGPRESAGHERRWVAPPAAVRAIVVMEQIYAPHRAVTGTTRLVLMQAVNHHTDLSTARTPTVSALGYAFTRLAERLGIPEAINAEWLFSSHQPRKTFARFAARLDRTGLYALAQQLGHAKRAITDSSYAGRHDIRDLLNQEMQQETAKTLGHILTAPVLGGKRGEHVIARNAAFRGRTMEDADVQEYVKFAMEEADIRLFAVDYGYCAARPETSRCGAALTTGPNDANRGPTVCASCSNLVVGPEHSAWWEERRDHSIALLEGAPEMLQAVLNERISECSAMLSRIEVPNV